MSEIKTVLCFGDSNTWGHNPVDAGRYARDVRGVGVVRRGVGDGYHIIEEGLNERTTVWDDPIEGYKNGRNYLIPCLGTHRPLDLVIIMLGTNDLKMRFSLPAYDIASGAGVLVDIVQRSEAGHEGRAPQVLLMVPPPVAKLTDFSEMFAGSEAKSRQFSAQYRRVADERNCALPDTSEVIVSSELDGIHFDPEEHKKLGVAVAGRVKAMIG